MRIELKDVEPLVWRQFLVDPQCMLPKLHLIVQYVMGWENHHQHCFASGARRFGPKDDDSDPTWVAEDRYRLRSLAREPGDWFTYEYDFGDSWRHRVTLERTLERSRSVVHPRVVAGANACPPEDCGGPSGYAELKLALASPSLNQYDDTVRWTGARFDPSEFDLRRQNAMMFGLRGTSVPWWAR